MRYNSLNNYLRNKFGKKVYKISIDGGFTCPNRDGKISTGGCIFCSAKGSGDFATSKSLSITQQIEQGKERVRSKTKDNCFIAYFQAFTNTYAPIDVLESKFTEAINHKDIVALSVATRPDCVDDNVLKLLEKLNKIKPVWVELGLQTMHDSTAAYIRRGYPLSVFEDAVRRLRALDLEVIVHTILGLPGETKEDILKTVSYLNTPDIQGIKLQLLHILKGTDLAKDYEEGRFSVYTMEEYIDLVIACLEHLSPRIVIHRLTGDGPKELLLAPLWSSAKKTVLNTLHHECKVRGSYQGRLYTDSNVHQMA